ncbi:hypothetical protein [Melittangium boletus]|uniref:Lipoprotein n=1 Tax=Melittangium boletus DSM 14713 TaxID=1294270 RepID=A0A250IEJ3_9BACT|nr:hypothetical protein [Melittangium boletus]ATB29561.1 hypothetical protein MEBOL_003016 [Melittangium boletus DSM 14713]
MRIRILSFTPVILLASCALFRHASTVQVPVGDDPSIAFPPFFDQDAIDVGASNSPYELSGEALRALSIAAEDFRPSGEEGLPCQYRKEAQTYRLIRQGDIFFISIHENLAHCGHEYPALDSGVRYAISRDGRILRRLFDGQPEYPDSLTGPDDSGHWFKGELGASPTFDGGTTPDAG